MTDTGLSAQLLDWYARHARDLPWRRPPGAALPADPAWPYRVWLSEIMLQQTTVAAAMPYFAAFTARWPTVADLAAASDAEVMAAWAGLGYYARARNLLACARAVVADHGGRFPGDEAMLRTLPGVGAYTAAAVAAIGFGRRAVVVDANVERVVARLAAIATPLPAARPAIRAATDALTPAARAGDFAQAMMDLGSRICTVRAPRCEACPIAGACEGRRRGSAASLPRQAAKAARRLRFGTAWWIESAGQVLTVTRPPSGLLGGMAALPSSEWTDAGDRCPPPIDADWRDCGAVTHVFTHFELRLRVKAATVAPGDAVIAAGLGPAIGSGPCWHPVAGIAALGFPTVFAKAAGRAMATTLPFPEHP